MVAGRPAIWVSNVTRPTMIVYSPKARNTGAAVVVFPGRGLSGSGHLLFVVWGPLVGALCRKLAYPELKFGGPPPEPPVSLHIT